ncbi:hypothetical protein [Pseudomonas sp. TCU-HL1]|uniref:hypothetical protein n=1 Tax=Pseudomonas sp. TCU-HL1 TaxID=1856685 RepID=UPI00083CB38D|nr:hypothetical protein [Pseudomonas sp. TCU-HL1]AOE83936.1 hypothetical protein THL1_1388 [Pseudomonas sp. TCU-HL1]
MDRMKLVKRSFFAPINEEEVENPFFAAGKVDWELRHSYFWPNGLSELIFECGATRENCLEEPYRKRIVDCVRNGEWLLVTKTPFHSLEAWKRADLAFFGAPVSAPAAPADTLPPPKYKPLQLTSTPRLRVDLRLGVFFDGTYNNAANAAQGQRCVAQHPITEDDLDASCQPYMRDPESSYGNGVTNIKCSTTCIRIRGSCPPQPSRPIVGSISKASAPARARRTTCSVP